MSRCGDGVGIAHQVPAAQQTRQTTIGAVLSDRLRSESEQNTEEAYKNLDHISAFLFVQHHRTPANFFQGLRYFNNRTE